MSFLLSVLPTIMKKKTSHRGVYTKSSGRESDEFATPTDLYQQCDDIVHFDWDVCASPRNHKNRHFWTKKHNGLIQSWAPYRCWMNPPYSNIYPWCQKAYEESQKGATVVGLLPTWTAEPWYHEFISGHAEVIFLNGRVKFLRPDGTRTNPMMASMIVIWRPPGTKNLPPEFVSGLTTQQFPKWADKTESQEPTKGVVLSLCDRTGNMVRPWAEAGYECICVDQQHPKGEHRRGLVTFVGEDIRQWLPPPRDYKIVFAAPPCTNLAVSGAAWHREKGIGGLMDGVELVEAARRICEWSQAPWMIENPVSTLASYWRKPDYTFHPFEFGGYDGGENDGYTKKTCLWTGRGFRFPEKRPIPLTRPNFIHHMPPSAQRGDLRSVTPPGFSRAAFEANVGLIDAR